MGSGRRHHTNDPSVLYSRHPYMQSIGNDSGDIVFRHREYVMDVTPTSSAFETQALLSINPGLAATFPLLSEFAWHFTQYQFTQLVFRFRSLVTDSYGTATGSVMMATLYDNNAAPFATKRDLENSMYTISGRVTDVLDMGIELTRGHMALGGTFYYIRNEDKVDVNDYDIGIVQLVTLGAKPNFTIGELWAEYVCTLSKLRATARPPCPDPPPCPIPPVPPIEPLAVGDGMSLSLSLSSGNYGLLYMSRYWLGEWISEPGTVQPDRTRRFPLPLWQTVATSQSFGTPPFGLGPFYGSLTDAPNSIPLVIGSTGPAWQTNGLDLRVPLVNAFSMSRDITATWVGHIDTDTLRTIRISFPAVTGAVYVWKMNVGIIGSLSDSDTTPTISRLPVVPTVVASNAQYYGRCIVDIVSGPLAFTHYPGTHFDPALGTASDVPTISLAPIRLVNSLVTGIAFTASGTGAATVSVGVDCSPNVTPGNVGCNAWSWSFTRIS